MTRQEKYCIISDKNQLFFSESWVIMQTLFFANGLKADMFFEFNKWTDINCPKHCHYTFEVVFVDSGEFIIEKEDVTYKLFKNDVMVIMPFEKHRFRTEKNSRISVLEMSTNIISNFDAVFRNRRLKICCCNLSGEEIKDIYTHLDNAENNIIEMNYTFFSVMSIFMKENDLIDYKEPDAVFGRAILYTSNHFDENICLKDVAKAINVNYVYLSRVFTKKLNIKFNDFLNSFRLNKAINLLKNPLLSVTEIGFLCGWGSIRSFNRTFLEIMGCTPTQFREKNI